MLGFSHMLGERICQKFVTSFWQMREQGMRRLLMASALLCVTVSPQAATLDGYMTSGGAGMVSCADFSNAIATARANGGMNSIQGLQGIQSFIAYAFGFYTHYNASTPGVYDVLAAVRGDTMVSQVMTIIDTWCAQNPLKDYDDAIVGSLPMLLSGAEFGTPP